MYNQPFFIPNYPLYRMPPMMRGISPMRAIGNLSRPLMSGASNAARGVGLMNKLGTGLSAVRSLNWSGLITNASKTLGVVNQAIPLVRQVGPMFNNVKSMLKVASVFKDETDKNIPKNSKTQKSNTNNSTFSQNNPPKSPPLTTKNVQNNSSNPQNKQSSNTTSSQATTNKKEDNSPTFFIPT